MMKQYLDFKRQYPDKIVLFRMGDFFETFGDDVVNGETVILGGMIKETERTLRRRVPGLSYIPLIGSLFQKVSKEKEKVDFVIFLTPQIISNPEEMRGATLRASGLTGAFASADIISRNANMFQ